MTQRHSLWLAAMLSASLLLGACAATANPAQTSDPDSQLSTILDLARADEASSDRQVEMLESAAKSGELPFEDYEEAVNTTLACLDDAGIEYKTTVDKSLGIPRITYTAKVGYSGRGKVEVVPGEDAPELEIDPQAIIAERCRDTHSKWIEAAYEEQPSAVEVYDTILEAKRPAVLDCAERAGIALEADLPIRELLMGLVTSGATGEHCLVENQIQQF